MVQAIFITLLPLQKTFSSCASVSCCFTDDWSLRLPHLNVMPPLNFYVGLFYKKKKKKARNAQCLCLHRAINATYLDFHKQPLTCPLIVLYLAVWASTGRMQEQPQNQGWNAEYLFSSPFPLGDPWMWAEAHKWGHRHRGTLSRRISSSAVYAC